VGYRLDAAEGPDDGADEALGAGAADGLPE
jgi:hypothetical protein